MLINKILPHKSGYDILSLTYLSLCCFAFSNMNFRCLVWITCWYVIIINTILSRQLISLQSIESPKKCPVYDIHFAVCKGQSARFKQKRRTYFIPARILDPFLNGTYALSSLFGDDHRSGSNLWLRGNIPHYVQVPHAHRNSWLPNRLNLLN
jgi:hypothetical protein